MRPWTVLGALGISLFALNSASAQVQKSTSSGFFVGLGVEGSGIVANQPGSVTESGGGAGLTLGYGFSRRWSLYGEFSGANINETGGGSYQLAHVDLGARVHFRTGPNTVVPFLQFGLAGRGIAQDINGSNVTGSGGGGSFGGGLNAHFNPKVAFTTAVTWTVGSFDSYTVDGQAATGGAVSATSARVQLGLLWFP